MYIPRQLMEAPSLINEHDNAGWWQKLQ